VEDLIKNKVKESGLVQLDLAAFKPKMPLVGIDLAEQLWQGFVLKEKDFRAWIKDHNWAGYQGIFTAALTRLSQLGLTCS